MSDTSAKKRKKARNIRPRCAFEPCGQKVHRTYDYCHGCKNHICQNHDETGPLGEHGLAAHTRGRDGI